MIWLGAAILVAVGLLLLCGNRLVRLRADVRQALAEVDVQLERRHHLVPVLVATVRGNQDHERRALERASAAAAAGAAALARGDVVEIGRAETTLSACLRSVVLLVERSPDLQSHGAIVRFTEDLTSTENRVAFARQRYNDCVLRYNDAVQVFPQSLVARAFRTRPAAYLELDLVTG